MSDQPALEPPVLQMNGLRIEAEKSTGEWVPIVHGVDLKVERGEVLGLIGESGAGKSTIGLAALYYARPGCRIAGGQVLLNGTDLGSLTGEQRRTFRGRRVAYVAQSAAAAFNPAKTINHQICEVALRHGVMSAEEARRQAIMLYERLLLPSPKTIGDRYPHQVSGGQLQRAMTAMAMVCKPDLLVLDEPTTALDVTTQIEVLAAVRQLIREERTAALYITHDLALVAQMSDSIMVLRHGKMVEYGEVRQIVDRPQTEYAKALIDARKHHRKNDPAPPPATPHLLEIRGVTAAYGSGPVVVSEVSLTIDRGETVAVVGESGSGKSSLARVVTGLLPPTRGEIKFEGKPLSAGLKQREKDALRRIQMIYQMPDVALNPQQRLSEVLGRPLEFYLGMTGAKQTARVKELLRMIELPEDFITRFPPELSGGQKQRVCVARALAAEPDLIICDEPTSALDPLVAQEILRLLRRLQKEMGLAYLFITHDLGVVEHISDKVVVMQRGRIVEQGGLGDIFDRPKDPYTELLLSSVPEMAMGWLDQVLSDRKPRGEAAN